MGLDPPFVRWTRSVLRSIPVVHLHHGETKHRVLFSRPKSDYQTRLGAQVAAIITQLVFEHALRIRVKAETGGKDKDDPGANAAPKNSANLLGKITNLVTVDLSAINQGQNLGFLVILVPIQVIGSIVFLYQILGWRLVGFLHIFSISSPFKSAPLLVWGKFKFLYFFRWT